MNYKLSFYALILLLIVSAIATYFLTDQIVIRWNFERVSKDFYCLGVDAK